MDFAEKISVKNKKCSVIILEDLHKKFLLYFRDTDTQIPYPQTWALIGGAINESEDPEDAIKRELVEELGLSQNKTFTPDIKFIFEYHRHDLPIIEYVYHATIPYVLNDLILKEGKKLAFFEIGQIKSSDNIAPHHKAILLKYLAA